MKTTARFTLSAATALGLASFTLGSAFITGTNAPVTVIAFALLAIYGLIEIAIQSYATPRFALRPAMIRVSPSQQVARPRRRTRVSAIVEMPAACSARRAA